MFHVPHWSFWNKLLGLDNIQFMQYNDGNGNNDEG